LRVAFCRCDFARLQSIAHRCFRSFQLLWCFAGGVELPAGKVVLRDELRICKSDSSGNFHARCSTSIFARTRFVEALRSAAFFLADPIVFSIGQRAIGRSAVGNADP